MGAEARSGHVLLEEELDAIERHLEAEDFRGWDPYDALCSPLFRLPVFRSNRLLRFGAQQTVKRSRANLRPLLRVQRQLNPVSLGLYVHGQSQRALSDPASIDARRVKAASAVRRLADLVPAGYAGSCWGYPFDWETRRGSVPAGTPTVVATGVIANGLWMAHTCLGIREAGELLVSAADFVTHDLDRSNGPRGSFCWSYSPRGGHGVINATLKGSRLLAQAYDLSGSAELLDEAARSVQFAIAHQRPSGKWPYSTRDPRADNFHTGYVLECLRTYGRLSGDPWAGPAVDRGWAYYRARFFTDDLSPKYFDERAGPLDATACAQAIITLSEFGDVDAAASVADRSLRLLGRPDGSFAYQRRGERVIRTPFLRWSTAWMYSGLSRFAQAAQRTLVPA